MRTFLLIISLYAASGRAEGCDGSALLTTNHEMDALLSGMQEAPEIRGFLTAKPDHPMWRMWRLAMAQLPAIRNAVANADQAEKVYFTQILQAAEAAVGKHHLEYLREKRLKLLMTSRHYEILRQIADFDAAKPRFSLYKVKRSIEGWHSLNEYIRCK